MLPFDEQITEPEIGAHAAKAHFVRISVIQRYGHEGSRWGTRRAPMVVKWAGNGHLLRFARRSASGRNYHLPKGRIAAVG